MFRPMVRPTSRSVGPSNALYSHSMFESQGPICFKWKFWHRRNPVGPWWSDIDIDGTGNMFLSTWKVLYRGLIDRDHLR
jgi:hypothetical protein